MTAGTLAQVACLMEATARKPGNVHRFADFGDATYLDFALSAQAIGPAMDSAKEIGVGRCVLAAIEATRRVVSTNTNLGMVLLLAPMAVAFERFSSAGSVESRVPPVVLDQCPIDPAEHRSGTTGGTRDCRMETAPEEGADLAGAVARVLDKLGIEDARHVYRAIRLAEPGGLGSSSDQDVSGEPTVTLLDAMRMAADRDLVARQYATGYADVFGVALPALREGLGDGLSLEGAIVRAHVLLLAKVPDTLIARKLGMAVAEEASRVAAEAMTSGDLDALDRHLRADGHARNPGATADLMAAALFAALAEGTIRLPRPSGPGGWAAGRNAERRGRHPHAPRGNEGSETDK